MEVAGSRTVEGPPVMTDPAEATPVPETPPEAVESERASERDGLVALTVTS